MRIVRSSGTAEEIDQLDWELEKLGVMKNRLADLQSELDEQTNLVTYMLDERGQKSRAYNGYQYTLVRAERTKINEEGLKKALGARAFNKLTTAKIDTTKVKSAIEDGTLDPVVLSQHAENVLNKPSIRISKVVDPDG